MSKVKKYTTITIYDEITGMLDNVLQAEQSDGNLEFRNRSQIGNKLIRMGFTVWLDSRPKQLAVPRDEEFIKKASQNCRVKTEAISNMWDEIASGDFVTLSLKSGNITEEKALDYIRALISSTFASMSREKYDLLKSVGLTVEKENTKNVTQS